MTGNQLYAHAIMRRFNSYHYILPHSGNQLTMEMPGGSQSFLTHVDDAFIFGRLRRIGAS